MTIHIIGFLSGTKDKLLGTDQVVYFKLKDTIVVDELPSAEEIKSHAISCGYDVLPGKFEPIYMYRNHAHEHKVKHRDEFRE